MIKSYSDKTITNTYALLFCLGLAYSLLESSIAEKVSLKNGVLWVEVTALDIDTSVCC